MTEFDVRAKLRLIEASDASPFQKAKAILRLRRVIRQRIASIDQFGSQEVFFPGVSTTPNQVVNDRDAATRLNRLSASLRQLDSDVRMAASRALEQREVRELVVSAR